MRVSRAGVSTLAVLVVCLAFAAPAALAEVRPLEPVQTLTRPATPAYTIFGDDVAIDGAHIIVLAAYNGGQQALHYRRSNSTGRWVFRRVLDTYAGSFVRWSVAMKNGIAAVQFGDQVSIFEVSAGDYVRGTSAAPIRHHGGVAISGNSVLIGGNNCDYDAVIYQKGSGGSWGITGRLDDNQGACLAAGGNLNVELHYNYALLGASSSNVMYAWRRNGTAVDWVPAGTMSLESNVSGNPALQGATAVSPRGDVWRRSVASTWTSQGKAISVDKDDAGPGASAFAAVFRDGVLMINEDTYWEPYPRVYVEVSPGQFEHVATLWQRNGTGANAQDVSGRTAVVAVRDWDYWRQLVHVYNLPSTLRVPEVAANDFEDRDVSDITFSGTPFAVVARGSDDVLTQNSTSGLGLAVFSGTDWTDQQRVEADIRPDFGGGGGWVGLVARYVDGDNYYYLAIRETTWGLYKRVNGVETLLSEGNYYNTKPPTFRATLRAIGNQISVHFSFQQGPWPVIDKALPRGSAGLATSSARADFEDLLITPTDWDYWLFARDWGYTGANYESDMNHTGGDWVILEEGDEEVRYLTGLSQRDSSGSAISLIGTPVANQDIRTTMRLDEFAPSRSGAWFGVLARYVDARNHYYVTARDNGQIQIRKIVNGVITVLASASYPMIVGQAFDVRFLVVSDQLQLWVDGVLVASAHDREIAEGQYGLATYRAAANFSSLVVYQP
jgi:hypothetical protein